MIVLVELAAEAAGSDASAVALGRSLDALGFHLDESFGAMPMRSEGSRERAATYVVRGEVPDEADAIAKITARPDVIDVWPDTPIEPF